VRLSVSAPRTWVPVSLSRFGEPVGKKTAYFSLLNVVAAASAISAHADDVVYKVRLENGVPQNYRLEVPPGISPVKLNPSEWNQPPNYLAAEWADRSNSPVVLRRRGKNEMGPCRGEKKLEWVGSEK
jgi:hypothetical protein